MPTAADRWGSRFCYIVDTAERRVSSSISVPASVDAYSFTIEVGATWKVTNPEAVVKANLSDGNEVVLARLKDELWAIGREFLPGDATGAEKKARSALLAIRELDEGITLLRSTARFRVDPRLSAAVLERDQDAHEGGRDVEKMRRLQRMLEGSEDNLIVWHLMQHRDDTGAVLQMLAEARDRNHSVRLGLLDRMLEHKLITDADAQPLRDSVLGQPIAPPVTMRPITPRAGRAALSAPGTPSAGAFSPPAPSPGPARNTFAVGDDPSSAPPATAQAAQPSPPAQPDSSAPPDTSPAAGGVKKWKPLKKHPDQDPG